MRPIQVKTSTGHLVADFAWQATSWSDRTRGWLGKPSAKAGEGLLLSPAASIHSLGMEFDLDLAFLDGEGRVLKAYQPLRKHRLAWGPLKAWWPGSSVQALELPAGALAAAGVKVGEQLTVEER